MEYTLIANSGIQLITCDLVLDLNEKPNYYFHEWFDEDEVQNNLEFAYYLKEENKFVRLAELESCRFVDKDGNLTVTEQEVLANPNITILFEGTLDESDDIFSLRLNDAKKCKISSLLNKWLPMPFLEMDALGNCKSGPYNWVRCKLIPKENSKKQNDVINLTLVIAIDTRAIYEDQDDYVECPAFISNSEKDKRFKLCAEALKLLDFCSGKNSWIRSYLMNLTHGVTELDDIKVKKGEHQYAFLASYFLLIDYLAKYGDLPSLRLMRDRDVNQINVEMIIDIGNSRTAAVLFENQDFTKVKPLRLQNFTKLTTKDGKLNRTDESFDMRVAFQKVSFGDNALTGSEQFVWPSIVRLGSEAEFLTHETTNLAEGDEILSTYSSPKRYLWDMKPRREEWRCVRQTNEGRNEEPIIEGLSNYFLDDGKIDRDGFGVGLHYSRKTLMTFAFLEILAQAQTQINSFEYRDYHGKISTPRRLDKIVLTCPTAMSKTEQLSLHNSLEDAIFVINKFRNTFDTSSVPIKIKVIPDISGDSENPQWIFDEATCSQFVYLYGKFSETYLNNTKEFFNIYGKKREIDGNVADSLVIGSLDIGAGTSDLMICRYAYNKDNESRLKPYPIFWDSFNYAGDDMLKILIENVLIQGKHGIFEKELLARGLDEETIKRKLYQFFGNDNNGLSFRDRTIRRDFNLQVCVPIMNLFLELLSKREKYRELTYEDIFSNNFPSDIVLEKFENHFGFSLKEIKWVYDSDVVSYNIEHSMNDLLENVATIMYAHDCDIVILSGRPTSLQPLKDVFLKYYNDNPNRLIILNKFRIGRWYPFADEFGYLTNSKSVVPVGAMIGYLASNAGGMNHFSLDLSALGALLKPTTDYFVLKDTQVHNNKCFITPKSNSGSLTLNSFPVYIGCKQFDLALYPTRPFYVLEIDDNRIVETIVKRINNKNPEKILTDGEKQNLLRDYKERLMSNSPFKFTFERGDYQENKEFLSISSIENSEQEEVPVSDFCLSVQSLNDPDCYWLDSGAFNINIKSTTY